MKHIEKITISNARRFGENVEIDFGKGATIILASNGTGKTTVFEAIELALTGEVKRLGLSQDAIISNESTEMNVRLAFSEGKYCQADYVKGMGCVPEGFHNELFHEENRSSLPYLLRLTHFLEQRGKEWFVDQDDKGAGNLLSKLPLGKDLQQIISKKTSLLRSIGTTKTSVENALSEAKKKLIEFDALKTERNGLATETKLTPLKELVVKLLVIGKLTDYEEYDDEYNVTPINTYFERIRVSIQQENNTKKDLLVSLIALKERVPLYLSNLKSLSNKQTVISEQTRKIAELKPIIENTKKDTQDAKDSLSIIEDEIKKLNTDKSMFEKVEQKRKYIGVKKDELEQNKKSLYELNKSQTMTVEYLKKNERLQDQHKLANSAIESQKTILNQTEQKKGFQKQWQEISKINQAIIEIIPEIEKNKNEYLKSKALLDIEISEADKVYLTKKNALESLNKASSTIQDAVSNIRKHLTVGQKHCPVCQANYEPDDLIKRIEKSLNTLNPAIPIAIKEEKIAIEALEVAKEKQKKENEKVLGIQSTLNAEHDKLEANKKKISESFLPQFPGCKTHEEAYTQLEEKIAQITTQINKLETERRQLATEVTMEEIDKANLNKNEVERSIRELTTKNEILQNDIKTETADINNINESLRDKEKVNILANLSNKSIENEKKIDSILKLEKTLSKKEEELKGLQYSILSEEEIVSKIKGSQKGICTEWSQAGIDGQPNEEDLKIKYEIVEKTINELDKANVGLNAIEQGLAGWRSAEKFIDADDEIKKQIGDSTEEAYWESLKISVDKKNNALLKIQNKKEAVNLFLKEVISEAEQIHEQLDSINEPWKGLLKRIVINPLIYRAPLLSNTTLRNQQIATTSANIHDQKIDIAKIASEAQLTDLQLTLMLSMANRYQWTPWKALLLDDPTQHHDLVHASSVFDVLRDYMIDLDYQVLMSTHNSIQANFFQRKLENEGVPSKIYQLVPRKGGVTAERII